MISNTKDFVLNINDFGNKGKLYTSYGTRKKTLRGISSHKYRGLSRGKTKLSKA
jgi:hypothetical protein